MKRKSCSSTGRQIPTLHTNAAHVNRTDTRYLRPTSTEGMTKIVKMYHHMYCATRYVGLKAQSCIVICTLLQIPYDWGSMMYSYIYPATYLV